MELSFTQEETPIFVLAIIEATFVVFQIVNMFFSSSSKRGNHLAGLLVACILYSVIFIEFGDSNIISKRYFDLCFDAGGLVIFWCFCLYCVDAYNLISIKPFIPWTTVYFLALPFLATVLTRGHFREVISETPLTVGATTYALFFLWIVAAILIGRIRRIKQLKKRPGTLTLIRFIIICMVFFMWLTYPMTMMFSGNKCLELIVLNVPIIVVGIDSIRKSKREYTTLFELNAKVNSKRWDAINRADESRVPLELMTTLVKDLRVKYGNSHAEPEIEATLSKLAQLDTEVQNIFDLSRLQIGTNIYTHDRPTNLSQIAKARLDMFSIMAKEKAVSLDSRVVDGLMVLASGEAMVRIVNNLLNNAIRRTPNGGSVNLVVEPYDERVRLSVGDYGKPISIQQQKEILTAFSKFDVKDEIGPEIGLIIAAQMVRDMGGIMSIESASNMTRFIIELDLYSEDVSVSESINATNRPADRIIDAEHTSILVIADQTSLLLELTHNLGAKHNVYVARNGQEALLRLGIDRFRPDLILAETVMDQMGGIELCQTLAKDERLAYIPFILIGGRTGDFSKTTALSYGAIDYFQKPLDYVELLSKIDAILTTLRRHRDAIIKSTVQTQTHEVFEHNCHIFDITAREKEIINLIRNGYARKEISARLGIKEKTVDNHCTEIYKKVGVKNAPQLVAKLTSHPVSSEYSDSRE